MTLSEIELVALLADVVPENISRVFYTKPGPEAVDTYSMPLLRYPTEEQEKILIGRGIAILAAPSNMRCF